MHPSGGSSEGLSGRKARRVPLGLLRMLCTIGKVGRDELRGCLHRKHWDRQGSCRGQSSTHQHVTIILYIGLGQPGGGERRLPEKTNSTIYIVQGMLKYTSTYSMYHL